MTVRVFTTVLLVACGSSKPVSEPAGSEPSPVAPVDASPQELDAAPIADAPLTVVDPEPAPVAENAPPNSTAGRNFRVAPAQPKIIGGDLDKNLIRKVFREKFAPIRACVDAELKRAGKPPSSLAFEIGPKGKVTKTRLEGASTKLTACIEKAAKQLSFPPPPNGASFTIQYPIVLQPAAP